MWNTLKKEKQDQGEQSDILNLCKWQTLLSQWSQSSLSARNAAEQWLTPGICEAQSCFKDILNSLGMPAVPFGGAFYMQVATGWRMAADRSSLPAGCSAAFGLYGFSFQVIMMILWDLCNGEGCILWQRWITRMQRYHMHFLSQIAPNNVDSDVFSRKFAKTEDLSPFLVYQLPQTKLRSWGALYEPTPSGPPQVGWPRVISWW